MPFNRRTIIVSLIFILLIAGVGVVKFTNVNLPYLNWLEKGIFNLFTSVIDFVSGFYNSAQDYWQGILDVKSLLKEKEMLEKRVFKLEREKQLMYYLSNENKRLRELLAFKEFVPYKTLGAKVIGYSPSKWENKILINRGARDGVKNKMPVISYNGTLVGRTDYVGLNSSQVLLINHPEFVVGGIVQRPESRAIGLVKGQLNSKDINIMDNIAWNRDSKEGDIKKGDIIVTSGLSNSYPKGIPIGKVLKVEPDNYGLSQKAEIKLFFNLKTVEEVLIITDF